MSYCLNPYCSRPQNPDAANFCTACGFRLRLGDRYRPLNRIGRGGFGRTFLAVDEYKPSRPLCVIKQFFPQNPSQQDPELATVLFRREAMQLEQLGSHPQIPELLAHFEQAGYHYLVQEFIDGQNLVQEVTERGAFTEQQIWHLLDDLLPVLEFIHHHHVIHRDIKPQNIIRRASTGQYVLVDFGAAKTLEGTALERTGTSIGSAEFTPPEQAIGKATFASDLYSLGVTCIYLLTHVRPAELFDTEEGTWVWQRHLDRPMSGVLANLLDKLLQGPTKRRYQSVEAVLEDLHAPEIVTGLGVVAGERGERGVVQAASVKPELPETMLPEPETMLPEEERPLNWRCQHTLTGHQSWVRSVVFQSNGALLASGSGDRTVKLWSLEGELQRTIAAHAGWVRAIATSPNGELLASCSNDRTVKVWQWQTGELVQTLDGHTDWVRSVMFSPEGKHLISGSQDGTVRIWYVATGKLLQTLRGHEHWVTSIAVAPKPEVRSIDDFWVISGSRDRTIRLWNWQQGQAVTVLQGHLDCVNRLAASPNGTTLASVSDDSTVRLWDLKTGNLRQTLTGHEGAVHSVAIDPTHNLLASGSQDRTIKLWDLSTGTLQHTLTGHANWIWSVAFSSDGETIASGSWDGTLKLWRNC